MTFTRKIFVLFDGEFDDVLSVLEDTSTVLQCTVVQSDIINCQQFISWLNGTGPAAENQ